MATQTLNVNPTNIDFTPVSIIPPEFGVEHFRQYLEERSISISESDVIDCFFQFLEILTMSHSDPTRLNRFEGLRRRFHLMRKKRGVLQAIDLLFLYYKTSMPTDIMTKGPKATVLPEN